MLEANLPPTLKHVVGDTAAPDECRVDSGANRVDDTGPLVARNGGKPRPFPSSDHRKVGRTYAAGARLDANLLSLRIGERPFLKLQLAWGDVDDGLHGLITTLVRS